MSLATVEVASERIEEVSTPSKLTFVDRFRHGISSHSKYPSPTKWDRCHHYQHLLYSILLPLIQSNFIYSFIFALLIFLNLQFWSLLIILVLCHFSWFRSLLQIYHWYAFFIHWGVVWLQFASGWCHPKPTSESQRGLFCFVW